jgi:hypothetical protein
MEGRIIYHGFPLIYCFSMKSVVIFSYKIDQQDNQKQMNEIKGVKYAMGDTGSNRRC